MDETKLYQDCKDFYKNLKIIVTTYLSQPNRDIVRKLFSAVDGKVTISERNRSLYYDGSVNEYTISGYIYDKDLDSCYIRLIEDLTMAYYRTNGGIEANNTYEFLDKLNTI